MKQKPNGREIIIKETCTKNYSYCAEFDSGIAHIFLYTFPGQMPT